VFDGRFNADSVNAENISAILVKFESYNHPPGHLGRIWVANPLMATLLVCFFQSMLKTY